MELRARDLRVANGPDSRGDLTDLRSARLAPRVVSDQQDDALADVERLFALAAVDHPRRQPVAPALPPALQTHVDRRLGTGQIEDALAVRMKERRKEAVEV